MTTPRPTLRRSRIEKSPRKNFGCQGMQTRGVTCCISSHPSDTSSPSVSYRNFNLASCTSTTVAGNTK